MKYFVVIIAVLSVVGFCVPASQNLNIEDDGENMKYFLVETSPGVYRIEDLVNAEIDTRVLEADVEYHFFSQSDSTDGLEITPDTTDILQNTRFSSLKETLFIIHGWQDSKEAEVNDQVKEAVLNNNDINVFVVDWSLIAGKNYISAKNSVVAIGEHIANFIQLLVDRYNLSLSKVALVGHSLGAHIAGNAGAALNGQVDHIVGLDPAGPLFSVRNIDNRLDPTDAKFVQVIHTNGGFLGFGQPAGHADYYPNGGSTQPGCGLDITRICAHCRAYAYYAEAISARNNEFVSAKCSSYRDYQRGRCANNDKSVMGGYSVDTSAMGDYYLDTNRQSPFAKG